MIAGAQIASAPRGNFIGPGLLGFAGGLRQGVDAYRQDVRDRYEMAQLEREAEQQKRQDEFAKRVGGLLGQGPGTTAPLPYNESMQQQAGAGTPVAGTNQPTGIAGISAGLPPMSDYLAAFPDAAGQLYTSMLKPRDPLRVNPGDTLLDPYNYTPIYSSPDVRAPEMRTIYKGGAAVQQEWDTSNRKWVDVGSGPRWDPVTSGGGITPAQTANNAEIDAARKSLAAIGSLSPDLIRKKILRFDPNDPLGLKNNPDFDPQFARLIAIAGQRKIGADPEFEQTWSGIYGSGAPVPDIGSDIPTSATLGVNRAPPAEVGGDMSSALPLPMDARGRIDGSRLRVGQIYDGGDGLYRWIGSGFEPVE